MMAGSMRSLVKIFVISIFAYQLIGSSQGEILSHPKEFCSNGSLVLVPASDEDQIELQCVPCGAGEIGLTDEERVWYRENVEEQTWSKFNSSEDGRVLVNSANSLIISNFSTKTDAGRYNCQDLQNIYPFFVYDANHEGAEIVELTEPNFDYNFFLLEGDSWLIKCPIREKSHSYVEWRMNGNLLSVEPVKPGGKCGFWCTCSVLYMRSSGDLVVRHSSPNINGNFTCSAEGKSWNFNLVVLPSSPTACMISEWGIFVVCILFTLLFTSGLLLCTTFRWINISRKPSQLPPRCISGTFQIDTQQQQQNIAPAVPLRNVDRLPVGATPTLMLADPHVAALHPRHPPPPQWQSL